MYTSAHSVILTREDKCTQCDSDYKRWCNAQVNWVGLELAINCCV